MPSEKERADALELLIGYVEDIGDSVEGDLDEVAGVETEGQETIGILCSHGTNKYVIAGELNNKFFSVIYPSFIVQSIALNLGDETVEELLEKYDEEELGEELDKTGLVKEVEEGEVPDDLEFDIITGEAFLAAKEWLDSLNTELQQEIRFHLTDRLSDSSVGYTIFPEKGDTVYGFQVERKVFPYEEPFTLQEFNQSVQAVISVGVNGHNFLGKTFNVSEELSAPSLPWQL